MELEDAKFGSRADLFGGPDVPEHDKGCSCFSDPGCDISVHAPLSVNGTSKVEEGIHLPDRLSPDCDVIFQKRVRVFHQGFQTREN